jgi:hypothetical protein
VKLSIHRLLVRQGGKDVKENHFEETIERLIDQALQDQRNLQSQRQAIDRELERVDRELSALRTTLAIYRRQAQLPTGEEEETVAQELRRLTQLQGLVLLAQRNAGLVRTKEAARLLVRAGKITNPSNAYNIVQHLLSDSGRFERVDSGTYRLLPSPHVPTAQPQARPQGQSNALGRFLLESLKEGGKTLGTLKAEATKAGFVYPGKQLGRVIHFALVGMAQNRLVEKVNGIWKVRDQGDKN